MSILQQESWRILGNLLYVFRGPLFPEDCDALKTLYFKITLEEKENGRQILLKWEGSKNTYVNIGMEDNLNLFHFRVFFMPCVLAMGFLE